MKNGKVIALSALSTALGLVFIILGAYIPSFDLSGLFFASLCIMLPLSKNSVKGAFLAYLSIFLLSLIFTAGIFTVPLCFLTFFGLHPIINYLQNRYKKYKILFFICKFIWFLICAFIMYYLFTMFVFEIEFLQKYAYLFIILASIILFPIYDYCMFRFQRTLNFLIIRLNV